MKRQHCGPRIRKGEIRAEQIEGASLLQVSQSCGEPHERYKRVNEGLCPYAKQVRCHAWSGTKVWSVNGDGKSYQLDGECCREKKEPWQVRIRLKAAGKAYRAWRRALRTMKPPPSSANAPMAEFGSISGT
jgi:hypothetical protein